MSQALRLAEWIAGEACGGSNWNKNAEATAAELRRLHAEVTRLGIREAADVEEIGRLHAENERLREALRELLPMAEESLWAPERDYRIIEARAILK